jgi:endonuclease/exonuclease/phosphatase (EEP) superfamily protein YafD
MPHSKNLHPFWKFLIGLFIAGAGATLIGRNHFVLGTGLILLRWGFFVCGVFFLYLTYKRVAHKSFRICLIVVLTLISLEFIWNKLEEEQLNAAAVSTEVSLMTYNIFFRNARPDASINKIKSYNPDILVVQELTPGWKISLDGSIGSRYPYRETTALRGTHGIGVYSKYPILNVELLKEGNLPYAQLLKLKINNKLVQLINVHLASPAIAVEHPENFISLFSANYDSRKKQLETIHSHTDNIESEFHAQLLIGDLNTTSYEPIYRDIKKHWVNLYDLAGEGWGLNFPNSGKIGPVITLDYLFGKGIIQAVKLEVIKGGSSDHLPLAGKIKI